MSKRTCIKYSLSKNDEEFLLCFQRTSIPPIFKTEYIDFMLFVEELDFWVCDTLIRRKTISLDLYEKTICEYDDFVKIIDIKKLDEQALIYYQECFQIVLLLKKYFAEQQKNSV